MAQGHTYYEPTEYEQMMLVAGWVKMEDIDPDYQRFLKTTPIEPEFARHIDYERMKRDWDALNAQYQAEVEPYYATVTGVPVPDDIVEKGTRLVKQMGELEYLMGY